MLTDAGLRRPAPGPGGGGRPDPGRPGSGAGPGPGGGLPPVGPAAGPATWALAGLTLASSAGLFRVFSGLSWVGPVVLTALATHLALWAMRRWRTSQILALPAALAVTALMVIWTVFGSTTVAGFPGWHTWSALVTSLQGLSGDIAATVAPVRPVPAFEVLAAGGAGVVAIFGDWAAFRWRSPLSALVGAVAAFVACCTAGQGGGRAWVIGLEVAAACTFLGVERCSGSPDRVWFAGVRAGDTRWAARGGAALGAAALVAAVALTPALVARDGVGALGWRAGPGGGPGERIVPNPLVSLQTRIIKLSSTPVFAVDAAEPSYWRLTSLDTFNGSTWTATGAYRNVQSRLPGVAAAPPGTRTVGATFQIQQLDSVWLPEQFTPEAVQGVDHVSYDPGSGSLIASAAKSNGLAYSIESAQYLDTLDPAALEAAPPLASSPTVSANLELPAMVDGPITQLAAQLTAGRTTEYDKALAIQDFLRGPRFTYRLAPVSDGSSSQALYNFLFVTRQGYCQQFAGAFAVLARAAGLPTRLAVGFATGTPTPSGGYQVYDHDAHTWPEVYFGPRFGWLPFEPTPGFSIPGATGYTGTASPSALGPAPTTTLPAGANNPAPSINKGVTPTTRHGSATSAPAGAGAGRSSGVPTGLAVALAVVATGLVWAAANVGLRRSARRRRRRRAEREGPAAVILDLWDDVCSELAWAGIDRAPAETDEEFARRATVDLHRRLIGGPARAGDRVAGLTSLAGLAGRAGFSPDVPPDLVARAGDSAGQVRRLLRDHATRTDRLRRVLSLPPGRWARLTRTFRPG